MTRPVNPTNPVPVEHRAIVQALAPEIFGIISRLNDIEIPTDEQTLDVLRQCMGWAFSLGAAYGQTSPEDETPDRIEAAFDIIVEGRLR
jgi:hypothetical protein